MPNNTLFSFSSIYAGFDSITYSVDVDRGDDGKGSLTLPSVHDTFRLASINASEPVSLMLDDKEVFSGENGELSLTVHFGTVIRLTVPEGKGTVYVSVKGYVRQGD
jgi:hypothetical protein